MAYRLLYKEDKAGLFDLLEVISICETSLIKTFLLNSKLYNCPNNIKIPHSTLCFPFTDLWVPGWQTRHFRYDCWIWIFAGATRNTMLGESKQPHWLLTTLYWQMHYFGFNVFCLKIICFSIRHGITSCQSWTRHKVLNQCILSCLKKKNCWMNCFILVFCCV